MAPEKELFFFFPSFLSYKVRTKINGNSPLPLVSKNSSSDIESVETTKYNTNKQKTNQSIKWRAFGQMNRKSGRLKHVRRIIHRSQT